MLVIHMIWGGAALQLNEAWKSSEDWYGEYIGAFAQSVLLGSEEDDAHQFARMIADNRDQFGNIFNDNKPRISSSGNRPIQHFVSGDHQ
jgi:hypothetical protein